MRCNYTEKCEEGSRKSKLDKPKCVQHKGQSVKDSKNMVFICLFKSCKRGKIKFRSENGPEDGENREDGGDGGTVLRK